MHCLSLKYYPSKKRQSVNFYIKLSKRIMRTSFIIWPNYPIVNVNIVWWYFLNPIFYHLNDNISTFFWYSKILIKDFISDQIIMCCTSYCPNSITGVFNNFLQYTLYICSILLNFLSLFKSTVLKRRSGMSINIAINSQYVRNWVTVIKWLNNKQGNFDMFMQILNKHTFLFFIRKLFLALNGW